MLLNSPNIAREWMYCLRQESFKTKTEFKLIGQETVAGLEKQKPV